MTQVQDSPKRRGFQRLTSEKTRADQDIERWPRGTVAQMDSELQTYCRYFADAAQRVI